RVQPWGEPLDERHQQRRIAQVGLYSFCDPGVLDLHRHIVAVDGGCPMNLANRGRGKCTLVEVAEYALERPAELPAHELLEVCERHRRNVVAERGEAALQLVL